MQPRGPSTPAGEPGPLDEETHARVLDHQPSGMIQGISEKGLYLVRMRAPVDGNSHVPGTSIELETVNVLGTTRHRDLSVMSQAELQGVVKTILCDNPEVCLSFYNRAGNLSLKMHAFAILPGIGNKKALEMVDLRGRDGWDDFVKLDADCGINAAELLADRLAKEIADKHLEPRLIELLLRREE